MEIYLDNCATTRVCADAADAALAAMREDYGNPSSLHKKGMEAERLMEAARRTAAALLGCDREEVYFTGGATESNNIAVSGGVSARKRLGKTIVASAVEHPSVAGPLAALEKEGYQIKRIVPRADGHFAAEDFLEAIDEDTVLLTMMMVNNELGTILPYEQVIPAARRRFPNLLIHMDGVQGFTKLPLNVSRLGIDLFSFSGHKLYAPKGIGGLYLRKGVRINPIQYGGGQEKGIRPGTPSVPLIAAMGAALALCRKEGPEIRARYQALNAQLREALTALPQVVINSPEDGCPHILNLSVPGFRSETMLHALEEEGIYVSSGSACAKGAVSEGLAAYGLPAERMQSALRISFSKDTTPEEIDAFAAALKKIIEHLDQVINLAGRPKGAGRRSH